jgi:hypothetical protein
VATMAAPDITCASAHAPPVHSPGTVRCPATQEGVCGSFDGGPMPFDQSFRFLPGLPEQASSHTLWPPLPRASSSWRSSRRSLKNWVLAGVPLSGRIWIPQWPVSVDKRFGATCPSCHASAHPNWGGHNEEEVGMLRLIIGAAIIVAISSPAFAIHHKRKAATAGNCMQDCAARMHWPRQSYMPSELHKCERTMHGQLRRSLIKVTISGGRLSWRPHPFDHHPHRRGFPFAGASGRINHEPGQYQKLQRDTQDEVPLPGGVGVNVKCLRLYPVEILRGYRDQHGVEALRAIRDAADPALGEGPSFAWHRRVVFLRATTSCLFASVRHSSEPRLAGKVCHEHTAGLGSIELTPTVEARLAFWRNIEDRLARLANRISTEDAARIRGSLSARSPIPSIEDQRGVQLTNARADDDEDAGPFPFGVTGHAE